MAKARVNYVESYWSGVVERLQAEVDVLNRLIPHRGEQGRANELSLFGLLESLLPRNVGVGTGIAIDSNGRASGQLDIIVYDQSSQPKLMAQTTQLLFPVETVLMTIEVKTTLDDEEIAKCVAAKDKFHQLDSGRASKAPYFILAYKSSALPLTLASKIEKIGHAARPDMLCVLSPGIIAGRSIYLREQEASEGYEIGLVPLHQQDEVGVRISNTWESPPDGHAGFVIKRNGVSYPITRLSQRNGDKFVCEPGRALLMFCQAMLASLVQEGIVKVPFLDKYLSGVAREVHSLGATQ